MKTPEERKAHANRLLSQLDAAVAEHGRRQGHSRLSGTPTEDGPINLRVSDPHPEAERAREPAPAQKWLENRGLADLSLNWPKPKPVVKGSPATLVTLLDTYTASLRSRLAQAEAERDKTLRERLGDDLRMLALLTKADSYFRLMRHRGGIRFGVVGMCRESEADGVIGEMERGQKELQAEIKALCAALADSHPTEGTHD